MSHTHTQMLSIPGQKSGCQPGQQREQPLRWEGHQRLPNVCWQLVAGWHGESAHEQASLSQWFRSSRQRWCPCQSLRTRYSGDATTHLTRRPYAKKDDTTATQDRIILYRSSTMCPTCGRYGYGSSKCIILLRAARRHDGQVTAFLQSSRACLVYIDAKQRVR